MNTYNFLDNQGLAHFFGQLKKLFGSKAILKNAAEDRRKYLLNIDYEKELAFDIPAVAAPYVGSAKVGETYIP